MRTYPLDSTFPRLLASFGVDGGRLLRKAGLAEDLFSRARPALPGDDYLALMRALGELSSSDDLAVRLATSEGIETFSPPIFAAYCARNGLSCLHRLRDFKPLLGPVRYRLESLGPEVTLYIEAEEPGRLLPAFLAEAELAFIVRVLRSATGVEIQPLQVESATGVSEALRRLAGVPVAVSGLNAITFAEEDLLLPFISHHEGMWAYFKPELSRRLSQLTIDEPVSVRVRAALMELLPAGESGLEDTARKLAVSTRTLQRQLAAEGTSFRRQLVHIRLLLARQYLEMGEMSVDTIALMLGYRETNSFVRAFTLWTGRTPLTYRQEVGR